MNYIGDLAMSIQDAGGNYLDATQNGDTSWNFTSGGGVVYLRSLPKGWEETEAKWVRDPGYMGVFRSQSNSFDFVDAARAILKNIILNGSVQGYAVLTIWIWNEATFGYDVFYKSRINFGAAKNTSFGGGGSAISPYNPGFFNAATLDSDLYQLLEAWGGNEYNIPFWTYNGTTWVTDAIAVQHQGIKLLYNATYEGGTNPDSGDVYTINGWRKGDHPGRHTIFSMTLVQITQNNGTTTFVGNDILNNSLKQGQQTQYLNEIDFQVPPNSMPFTNQNYIMYNLLADVQMSFSITFGFANNISYNWDFPDAQPVLSFVLFEIDPKNACTGGSLKTSIHLFDVILYGGGGPPQDLAPGDIGYPTDAMVHTYTMGVNTGNPRITWPSDSVTLKKGYVYVFGCIYDYPVADSHAMSQDMSISFTLSKLELSCFSMYNSGSAAPVPAPSYTPSPLLAFRPAQILQKLVPCLNSLTTDAYGFPVIPAGTPYTGRSDYLSDMSVLPQNNHDNIPWATVWTSASALQDLEGQPYLSLSVNDFFQACFSIWGMGLGIENDVSGNPTVLRMEQLSYFFDKDTMIVDLGTDVANLTCRLANDILVNILNTGYSAQNTNNDFGIDAFNREQDYNTPLSQIRQTNLNLIAAAVVAEMYAIEKLRVQQAQSPLPISATAGQSNNNNNILLEINFLPANDGGTPLTLIVEDPGGNAQTMDYYNVLQYNNAQSTDPTAASAPYIKGLYYPDTAINLGITPVKNIQRIGGYLRALCDGSETGVLTFRKIYQMLFNGTATELPGIQTNLNGTLTIIFFAALLVL